MRLLRSLATLVVLLAVTVPATALDPITPLGGACTTAPLGQAATALLAPGSQLVADDGDTALALEPGIAPGIRTRLVADGDAWCTAGALNLSLDGLLGGGGDAVAVASRAAQVLPAAHFDQVTVTDAREVAPGRVQLTTHAVTNGVVADWVVEVDDLGVRRAEWTATAFAVPPFEAEIEGLTALPGATMAYERGADGLLTPTVDVLALGRAQLADDPSPTTTVVGEDGFTMHVVVGDATFAPGIANTVLGTDLPRLYGGLAPDAGQDTGDAQVDYLRIMAEALEENHADFLAFGYEPEWADDEGNLYVDGALAAYCLACVLVSEYFNINMSRAAHEALAALGYTYPGDRTRDAIINVVGHEMWHNVQNAYGKPDTVGGARHNSYSEGTARFSETLHRYSDVSHQPGSLVYADDINGCNGWQGADADAAFAAGPLTGQSYDACYFWMTLYAAYGLEAVVEVVTGTAGLEGQRPWQIYDSAILEAVRAVDPDATLTDVLANFAAMGLTGRDYRWGAPADPGAPVLDWAEFLDRWTPASTAAAGDTLAAELRDGGIAAWELTGDAVVGATSDLPGHAAVLVTDDGTSTQVRELQEGDAIALDGGTTGWVVLLSSSDQLGTASVELR